MKLLAASLSLGATLFASASAGATTYHIDSTVPSSGDGTATSPLRAWSDLPTMRTGDDVYFKCGTTHTHASFFGISWEGTASDPAVVGAYYLDGDEPVYGVQGARPILSGDDFSTPPSMEWPYGAWSGLLQAKNKSHVHIVDLHIYKSAGHGIRILSDDDLDVRSTHFLIDNCKTEYTLRSGISVSHSMQSDGVVSNNEIVYASYGFRCWQLFAGGDDSYRYCTACSSYDLDLPVDDWKCNWPVSLTLPCSSHVLVKGNYVHESWGEGIGTGIVSSRDYCMSAGNHVIEDNVVYATRRVALYIDGTDDNILRRNILVGEVAKDGRGWSGGTPRNWNQFGMWINSETYHGVTGAPENNQVYNNVVVGFRTGFGWGSEDDNLSFSNNKVFNNTFMANYRNYYLGHRLATHTASENEMRNNIFACPEDTLCSNMDADHAWAQDKIAASHNGWSGSIPSHSGDGDADIVLNDVSFPGGFDLQNVTPDQVSSVVDEFVLLSTSNARDAGVPFDEICDADFFGTARPQGSRWDLGAHEYRSDDPTYECNDGVDNDGDGAIDDVDSGCESGTDNDESDCGDGTCEGGEDCDVCEVDCDPCAERPMYQVRKIAQSPTLDGDLSEFAEAEVIVLRSEETGVQGFYRLLWDDNGLYVAAAVTDSQVNAAATDRDQHGIWFDDAVELFLDTANDGGSLAGDDFKFFVNVHGHGVQCDARGDAGLFDRGWNAAFQSHLAIDGSLNQAGTAPDIGYSIEILVPWAELGVAAPSVGSELGFDLGLRDMDDSRVSSYAMWSNIDGGNPNEPDGWGNLVFADLDVEPCGDGTCDPATEDCTSCSLACPTTAGEVCCGGVIFSGDCCGVEDCTASWACLSHECTSPDCSDESPVPCYDGPADTRGVGICQAGLRTCTDGSWGECVGQTLPLGSDECGDGLDNDCDGSTDATVDCTIPIETISGCECRAVTPVPALVLFAFAISRGRRKTRKP